MSRPPCDGGSSAEPAFPNCRTPCLLRGDAAVDHHSGVPLRLPERVHGRVLAWITPSGSVVGRRRFRGFVPIADFSRKAHSSHEPRAERLCHPFSRSSVRCRRARTSNSLKENDHEDDRNGCAAGAIDFGRNLYWRGWWNRRGVRNANQSAASALTQLTAIRSRLRFGERSNRPTVRAFSRISRATPRPLRLPQLMRKTGRYGRGQISSSVHCWSCQAIESREGVLTCVNCYLSAW